MPKCRYSSVVEHVIGNDGVVSPILTSGTIFKNSAFVADFFFLNNHLFSPILSVFIVALLGKLIGLFVKTPIKPISYLLKSLSSKMSINNSHQKHHHQSILRLESMYNIFQLRLRQNSFLLRCVQIFYFHM